MKRGCLKAPFYILLIFKTMNKFKSFVLTLQAFRQLLKDKEAGKWPKIFLILAFIYLLCPVDLISDFLPFLGLVDDFLILMTTFFSIGKLLKKEPKRNNS